MPLLHPDFGRGQIFLFNSKVQGVWMRNRSLLLGWCVLLMATLSSGQMGEIARQLGLGNKLSDNQDFLRTQAGLQVGAEQSVKLTGRPDGYFGNPEIKILMPRVLLRTLEMIGMRILISGLPK